MPFWSPAECSMNEVGKRYVRVTRATRIQRFSSKLRAPLVSADLDVIINQGFSVTRLRQKKGCADTRFPRKGGEATTRWGQQISLSGVNDRYRRRKPR